MKRWIVSALERTCTLTHPITMRRPWLWWFQSCPLVDLSVRLEDRWDTGNWVGANPQVPTEEQT